MRLTRYDPALTSGSTLSVACSILVSHAFAPGCPSSSSSDISCSGSSFIPLDAMNGNSIGSSTSSPNPSFPARAVRPNLWTSVCQIQIQIESVAKDIRLGAENTYTVLHWMAYPPGRRPLRLVYQFLWQSHLKSASLQFCNP